MKNISSNRHKNANKAYYKERWQSILIALDMIEVDRELEKETPTLPDYNNNYE
jgi:hypothetical protein